MAHIYRLIRGLVLGVALAMAAGGSHAETQPATPGPGIWSGPGIYVSGGFYTDFSEGCRQDTVASYGSSYSSIEFRGTVSGGVVRCEYFYTPQFVGDSEGWYYHHSVSIAWRCSGGAITYSVDMPATVACGVGYTCPDSSWTLSGQTCTRDDNCPEWGTNYSSGVFDFGTDPANMGGSSRCTPDGCLVLFSGAYPTKVSSSPINGAYHYYGTGFFDYTSDACTPGADNALPSQAGSVPVYPENSPGYECISQGKSFGTVNGLAVCYGEAKPDVDTTINPDGSETKSEKPKADSTETTTKTNPDGSTTTTSSSNNKTTSCTNGVCTTTTTSTNSDGTSTTSTKQEPQSEFCESNPKSPLCVSSTFGNAKCDAAPACTGDAIQCAQAVFSWEIKCALTEEPTDDAYKLGKAVASGGDDPAGNPFDPANIEEIDVESIVSQAAGQRFLSGTCVQPPSFSVLGRSYTMDTTKLCQFAEIVGNLMVALSTIIAIRMITS